MSNRPLYEIAGDILDDPALKGNSRTFTRPYLNAMLSLTDTSQNYGADSGDMIVRYALSNLTHYRGDLARGYKAELMAHLA